jgi:hypothetical protein
MRRSRTACSLVLSSAMLLLVGCASRDIKVSCDRKLQPINIAPLKVTAAGSTSSTDPGPQSTADRGTP